MAECENFNCKMTCSRKSENCKSSCLHALYVFKCSVCSRQYLCQGSELYQKAMMELEAEKATWIKKKEPG